MKVARKHVTPNETMFDGVQREMQFFMEKNFQASFGYFGVLAALVAAAKLDVASFEGANLSVPSPVVIAALILVTNAVYLTVSAGTLFAVLKRGLFILTYPSGKMHPTVAQRWESFLREKESGPFRGPLAWNLDNYYMIPLLAVIGLVSVVSTYVGLKEATNLLHRAIVLFAAGIHLIPAYAFSRTITLEKHCKLSAAEVGASTAPDKD